MLILSSALTNLKQEGTQMAGQSNSTNSTIADARNRLIKSMPWRRFQCGNGTIRIYGSGPGKLLMTLSSGSTRDAIAAALVRLPRLFHKTGALCINKTNTDAIARLRESATLPWHRYYGEEADVSIHGTMGCHIADVRTDIAHDLIVLANALLV